MNERQPDLGRNGQNAPVEPAAARALLAWIGGLADCVNLEVLARRAGLSSRTLARFAAGMAGRGGHKTLASLLDVVQLPLEVASGVMLPTLRMVDRLWRRDRVARSEPGEDFQATYGALHLATRASWLELLARQAEGVEPGSGKTRTGLNPADARVLIGWFQALGNWPRRDLALRSGVSHEALRMYADGTWPLERPALQSLAAGVGVPAWLVEGLMLPALRAVRHTASRPHRGELPASWAAFAGAALVPESLRVSVCADAECRPEPAAADRSAAEELWRRLQGRSATAKILLVKNFPEYHSWAVVERLCTASREAATESVKDALRLALLALRVARFVRTEAHFSLQLEGFSFVHVANALRVLGRLQRADKAYARGYLFWQAGKDTRFPLLPGWLLLDLGGSLRRDQRRFAEAICFLDSAREVAPREVWARILLNKATVLDQQGEPAAAAAVLAEAAAGLDSSQDPALYYRLRCMTGSQLCHLGRYREAAELMPGTIALVAVHGRTLDNLRLVWLRGRIEAGLGHREEALAAFTAVREEFHQRGMAFDYALASLEASGVLLQEGRYEEVQTLALEMEWIFRKEGVSGEAEKAIDLFRQAAEGRTATAELAGKVVRFLYKVQLNPELRFAA